jgi:hypothetical protein
VKDFSPPLDSGIKPYVEALIAGGIETFESCQGGLNHSYPEPTIRFHGDSTAGFRAFAVATERQLPVTTLRRIWIVIDGEPTGPYWEMTFSSVRGC